MLRATLLAALAGAACASPYWDYVHTDDGAFAWRDTGKVLHSDSVLAENAWTGYLLNVTSQKWLTPADFVGSIGHIWTHSVLVVVPNRTKYADAAAMWITGNGNDGAPDQLPSNTDEDVLVCAALAVTTGTVCTVLYQIPNAPVVFAADPLKKSRSEDALVAFTWAQYMLHDRARPEWISYFPMGKAAIKTMDATTEFVAQKFGRTLKRWVTAGASKRGATTWFTGAAADPRIIGIIPVVFDVLSFRAGVQHMWQTLGNWTFAFTDYRDMNVTLYLNDGSDNLDVLAAQMDPLAYKENLTMAKIIVDATGDEFFQPQDDDFWWGQLPGETLRIMADNAEHSFATGALYLVTAAEAWFKMLLDGTPRPTFSWTIANDTGAITVTTTGEQPVAVVNRMTTTLDGYRRDFRLVAGNTPANPCTVGIPVPVFGSACLKPILWIGNTIGPASTVGDVQTWVATQDPPLVGWRAWLVELYYNSTTPGLLQQYTTQVAVRWVAAYALTNPYLSTSADSLTPSHPPLKKSVPPGGQHAAVPIPSLQGRRVHRRSGVRRSPFIFKQ
jgi:PhoPQ-activated pathogenicity-related protein